MKLQLYYAPRACSLVPFVALTEAGAAFDVIDVNFARRQHFDPAFLSVNPKHKVPVLVIDGQPLTENVAILMWIARQYPQAQLLPQDPWQLTRAISLMAWCASGIHPALTPNANPQQFCDIPGTEDGVRRVAHAKLAEAFGIADQALAGREWLLDDFSLADAYFYWCLRRGKAIAQQYGTQFGLDPDRYTHCQAHFTRMEQRASVQAVLAYEAATLERFAREA